MSRNLRFALLFTICALVYIMSYFHRVTPTILSMDLMADFHISAGELGLFSSAAMLAYGLMQLPSGMLADLFGGKNTLILLCLLSGAGTMAFAATHSMNGAFVARFIVGTGAAVTVPLITVLAVWCPPELFVRSSAVIFSMAGIGGVLAAPPVYFLSSIMGWRLTMTVFGAFSLLLAVLVCLCIPGRRNAAGQACSCQDLRALMKGAVTVFKSPVFRTLGIWYMMLVGSAYCMTTLWWGPYLMQGCGLSQSAASTAMSVISLGVMAAFLLLGWMADSVVRAQKTASHRLHSRMRGISPRPGSFRPQAQSLADHAGCGCFFRHGLGHRTGHLRHHEGQLSFLHDGNGRGHNQHDLSRMVLASAVPLRGRLYHHERKHPWAPPQFRP